MIWLRTLVAIFFLTLPVLSQSAEISVELIGGDATIEFGTSFDLLIERNWSKDSVPAALDLSRLSGLKPEIVGFEQVEVEGRQREVTRLRCWAVALDRVEIPALEFSLQHEGKEILARSEPFEFPIKSLLPENDIGKAAELPPEIPASWQKGGSAISFLDLLLWTAFILSLSYFLWTWRLRRRLSATAFPLPSPEDLFQQRMNALASESFQPAHFAAATMALRELLVALGQMSKGALTFTPEAKRSLGTELSEGIEDLFQRLYSQSYCPELATGEIFAGILKDCSDKGQRLIEETVGGGSDV